MVADKNKFAGYAWLYWLIRVDRLTELLVIKGLSLVL